MAVYDQILARDGVIEFKTDNRGLFDYSLEAIPRLAGRSRPIPSISTTVPMNEGNVMTEYEEKFSSMGNPICKLVAARKSRHMIKNKADSKAPAPDLPTDKSGYRGINIIYRKKVYDFYASSSMFCKKTPARHLRPAGSGSAFPSPEQML